MSNRTFLLRILTFLVFSFVLLGSIIIADNMLAPPVRAEGPSEQATSSNPDDEIVLLRDGKLLIYDPYPLNGVTVNWSVDDATSWRDIAAGDFNGDNDDEIVVINSDNSSPYTRILKAYDPVVGPQPAFTLYLDEAISQAYYRWWRVATGDVNNDGKDEIVVVTYPRTSGFNSDFYVYNQAGGQICTWLVSGGYVNGLTVADTKNDNFPEIVMSTSRSEGEPDNARVQWRDGLTCASLGSITLEGYAFDVAAGDLDGNDQQEEVIMAGSPRDWNHDDCNSLSVWKAWGGKPLSTDGWWSYNWPGWGWGYYVTLSSSSYSPPYWNFIVAADLNGSGDKEVATIRNTSEWDSEQSNHMKILDPNQQAGFTDVNKTYDTAAFEGIAAGDFAGVGRDYVALLWPGGDDDLPGADQFGSVPGVYLYDLGSKPQGGLGVSDDDRIVAPKKTHKITVWDNERAKVMTVGDFDGSWLTSSAQSVAFTFLQDGTSFVNQRQINLVYPGGVVAKPYTVTESPPVDWLTVTPTTGTLPGTLTFNGSLTGITALYDLGTYTTTVIITATESSGIPLRGSPITMNVNLRIIDHLENLYLPIVQK